MLQIIMEGATLGNLEWKAMSQTMASQAQEMSQKMDPVSILKLGTLKRSTFFKVSQRSPLQKVVLILPDDKRQFLQVLPRCETS